MKRRNGYFHSGLCYLAALIIFSLSISCNTYKNIPYFQDVQDSIYLKPDIKRLTQYTDPRILPKDILQVTIQTLDPQISLTPGSPTAPTPTVQGPTPTVATNTLPVSGFLVDSAGMIELPMVGKIAVAGKTTSEAKEAIRLKAAIYYNDPVINVRFANFNITILGEVNRPAQYTVPNEKVSIIDALGMAGDLTIYAKRENIMLIREENGVKQFIRFNLNSSSTFQNPYFYLKQGDVIYVEPNKSKAANNDVAVIRNLSIITSVVSLLVVVISRVNF